MSKPILVDFKTGKKIKSNSFSLERNIQKFVEENMEEIFNIRFLQSEVSFDDINYEKGRIDSIGIDENNRPVIFEYKLNERNNIIGQSLFYLKLLKSHKEKFEMIALRKFGQKVADSIEWKPRIICIANKFDKYSIIAIKEFYMDITLVSYNLYGDNSIVAFEYLNNFSELDKLSYSNNKKENSNEIISEDSFKSEFVNKYDKLDDYWKDLVNYISTEIENISNEVSSNILKHYKAFRKIKNFVCMVIQKQKIHLFLSLKYTDDMKAFSNIEDFYEKEHLGTGDIRITITSKKEFEDIFKYIEKSYDEN